MDKTVIKKGWRDGVREKLRWRERESEGGRERRKEREGETKGGRERERETKSCVLVLGHC